MVQRLQAPRGADLDSVFLALADPTRRAIVNRLADGEASISTLAQPFEMSLPAVVKHVRILERAGLVEHEKVGRERRCRLVAAPLRDADEWLVRYRTFWQSQLGSLHRYLSQQKERS